MRRMLGDKRRRAWGGRRSPLPLRAWEAQQRMPRPPRPQTSVGPVLAEPWTGMRVKTHPKNHQPPVAPVLCPFQRGREGVHGAA
jgi:hypothetical protein